MGTPSFLKLHPLLGDRVRLTIMAMLSASPDPLSFNELLEELELTKGNLSSHLRKLEDAKLIKVEKEFVDRKPRTTYGCSAEGRKEVKKYLETVESLLKQK